MIKNWIDHKIRRIHIEIQETAIAIGAPVAYNYDLAYVTSAKASVQAGLDEMRRLLAQGGGGTGGGSAATQGVYDTLEELIASASFLSRSMRSFSSSR